MQTFYTYLYLRSSYSSNIFHISGCKLWLSFKGPGKSLCKTIIRRTIGFFKKRNTIIAAIFCFRIITKTTRQKTAGIGVWEINLIFSFEKNILITYSIEVIQRYHRWEIDLSSIYFSFSKEVIVKHLNRISKIFLFNSN